MPLGRMPDRSHDGDFEDGLAVVVLSTGAFHVQGGQAGLRPGSLPVHRRPPRFRILAAGRGAAGIQASTTTAPNTATATATASVICIAPMNAARAGAASWAPAAPRCWVTARV